MLRAARHAPRRQPVSLTIHPNFLGDHRDIDVLEQEGIIWRARSMTLDSLCTLRRNRETVR
jgi:hypothetical protein